MRRRRILVSVGLVLGFIALILIGILAMVKREPDFYVQADMEAGPQRVSLSQQAMAQYSAILGTLDEPQWTVSFTTDQINAFFQEGFFQVGGDENLADGFHAPRVRIDDGRMLLGARWGCGPLSTVLSIEIRMWKVADELNTLALEIVSLQAGSLPWSTGTLLDRISTWARREHIDISWYRKDGHPVAVMRFQSDLSRPTFQFDDVELRDGRVTIRGRSTDPFAPPLPRVVSKP
jgi:hypothetical protein